ncbi:MAG: hypothetical protein IT210_11960 [Armatimonadetes bacterium]|nr:hypothetical protein [Armatimonadota bacterium]
MKWFRLCLLLLLNALTAWAAPADSGSAMPKATVLGPAQDVRLIEDFTADRKALWPARGGENIAYRIDTGYHIPGVAATLMRIGLNRKSASDGEPSHNWFQVARKGLPADAIPTEADGLRLMLGSHTEAQWWVSVGLVTEGGASFSYVIDHPFPAGRMIEYNIPFEEFRSHAQARLSREQAAAVREISFTLSAGGPAFYLDKITAYRRERYGCWLDFSTSHPATNLFQRTDPVTLVFTIGGALPDNARGFRYEVSDYFGRIVSRGRVPFSGSARYRLRATPKIHGYYEARAFLTDAQGKDIEKRSCIRTEGTVPEGIGTFSVLPATLRENRALFQRMGQNAFFGLHGDFLGLADHIGLAWRFDYSAWRFLEPSQPDPEAGMPDWVKEAMARPPQPPYRLHIQPFLFNLKSSLPEWAKSGSEKAPAFKDWADATALLRRHVTLEKRLYPHMRPRIYGGGWEINLNMPPYISQPPEHTPQDVAELYRRVRETVKAEDPGGIVIGPCPSTLNIEWFERAFRAGVLEYLDGIETHGYNDGVVTPEENDLPGKIRRLNALIRRYKGKTLPIYITERGERGILGAGSLHREQARKMARAAIILKGEGIRAFLPFYGIDYDREGYGFAFNPDVDAPSGPWATKRISPKPMANAVAACAKLLEGAAPKTRIKTLGPDVWAYVFTRKGQTVTAAWTTGRKRKVLLPVGSARAAEVVNIMGHTSRAVPRSGRLALVIDDTPVYVVIREKGP